MAEVHIPFTAGQSEAVDSKLLPQGLFVQAKNVRYAKDAKLAVRAAYRNDSAVASAAAATLGAATVDRKSDLYIKPRQNSTTPAILVKYDNGVALPNDTSATFMTYCPGDLGVFEAQVLDMGQTGNVRIAAVDSIALSATRIAVAYVAYNSVTKAATTMAGNFFLTIRYLDAATGHSVFTTAIGGITDASNVKLALNNGVLCVFYASVSGADEIRMSSFNTTTFASVTSNALVTATSAGRSFYFDISPGGASTETYLVYQSAANTLRFGTVSSVGVFSALSTIATTAAEARPSISPTGLAPTDQIVIVWNDGATFITGNARYTVYRRSTASFLVATTTVYAGGDVTGYPVCGPLGAGGFGALDWVGAFNTTATSTAARTVQTFTGAGALSSSQADMVLASKPLTFASGSACGIVVTDVDTATLAAGAYSVMPGLSATAVIGTHEARFSNARAQPADAAAPRCDPRRHVLVDAAANGRDPGLLALMVALPVATDSTAGWALYRSEYGTRSEKYMSASINGDVHFSGPLPTVFDGNDLTDMGFSLPEAPTLTGSNTGLIADGTYQFVIVWEYVDFKGRRWRSAPSLPTSITVAAGGINSISVSLGSRPHATNKLANVQVGSVRFRVYRTTLVTPTIFQDAFGSALRIGATNVAIAADVTIAAYEILYTQGARGGLSGLLQNDRPPACRYLWAGSDRLIAGGLEDPAQVQFSKLRVDGEPMQWTNDGEFKASVDTRVTAVAEMDGTYLIFTDRGIWTIGGAGPDDNGGGASFSAPRRLPTDIGCIAARSLVLTGQGLIFQGRNDCLFLIPRGGSAPHPIGWEVRDTLTSFPYVAASAFDQKSNVAYWAVTDTTASAGRLIVYDTRIGQWYVDSFLGRACYSLSVYDSLLHIDGSVIETVGNYQDSDGSATGTVIPVLEMGDTRPFGMNGFGRLRNVTLLGELRDSVAAPTMEVSYDSGRTYGESVSVVTSGSAGDTVQLEHEPVRIRGDSWRFRFSWTAATPSEGIIFNGVSLTAYPAPGLKRLGPTART